MSHPFNDHTTARDRLRLRKRGNGQTATLVLMGIVAVAYILLTV